MQLSKISVFPIMMYIINAVIQHIRDIYICHTIAYTIKTINPHINMVYYYVFH